MDFSASAVKKNVATTFKRLTQLVIAIAVLFSVLNLYFYFSIPKEHQLSFEEALTVAQKRNSDSLKASLRVKGAQDLNISAKLYSYILCESIGDSCGPNLTSTPKDFNNSIAGGASRLFLFPISHPPSSSIYVAAKTIEKAGFIPPSYAQEKISNPRGLGFASIEYISTIWLGLRNLAYIVIALIMISIGFMIMFRMKLGSQTVIAIENAIPRIILALIAITFSFAIAGFLIDLMYISIVIIAGVFGAMNIGDFTAQKIVDQYMFAGPDDVIGFIFDYGTLNVLWGLPGAIIGAMGSGVSIVIHLIGAVLGWYFIISKLALAVGKLSTVGLEVEGGVSFFGTLAGKVSLPNFIAQLTQFTISTILITAIGLTLGFWMAKLVVGLIILFTAIQLGIKIFVMLLSSYIRILLLIIFSPILLLLEAIPGKSMFTEWLRNLFAEIATFPIAIVLFLVGALLIKSAFVVDTCVGKISIDPDVAGCSIGAFPFLWEFDASSFTIIVAFGFLFLIPQYVETLKKSLNPNAMDLAPNAGLGMFFGSVTGLGKAGFGGIARTAGKGVNNLMAQTAINRAPDKLKPYLKNAFFPERDKKDADIS